MPELLPRRSAGPAVDAVIIGAGHHGLVAAATLADAGWDVLVLEQRQVVGGAVHSSDRDGWVMDTFSACHPLALASPVLRHLDLPAHGLRWAWAPTQVAHLARPGESQAPAIEARAQDTAAALAQDAARDGATWLRLVEQYEQVKGPLLDALLTQWPPLTSAARLLRRVHPSGVADFARFLLLPALRLGEELFEGRAGRELLAGNALHADVPLTAPVSGMFGWLLAMLAQDVGYPAPVGGAGQLAAALARRAQAAGAQLRTGVSVDRIVVRDSRVAGVRTLAGEWIAVRRAVVADTSAPALYGRLLDPAQVPDGLRARVRNFAWDLPTVKTNYRLAADMPWTARQARAAGVVHVGRDVPGMVRWSAHLESGRVPTAPFALVGQMTTIDPTRSPRGTQALWLYTHLPRGVTDEGAARATIEHTETMLDAFAPGWRELVLDRWDQTPADLQRADANLGDGAVGGGTSQLFQQGLWRPATGFGGPRTHLRGLYLGSAASHPGGGVHGACGYLAARAALRDVGLAGRGLDRLRLGALHRLYGDPAPGWVGRAR